MDYHSTNKKCTILCYDHGPFDQTPGSHIYIESGCPQCARSRLEIAIENFLDVSGYEYQIEWYGHKDNLCVNPKTQRHLRFDFYIPELNLVIEAHGKQHYEANNYFHHKRSETYHTSLEFCLMETQWRDLYKELWCHERGIAYAIVSHEWRQKSVEDILGPILI